MFEWLPARPRGGAQEVPLATVPGQLGEIGLAAAGAGEAVVALRTNAGAYCLLDRRDLGVINHGRVRFVGSYVYYQQSCLHRLVVGAAPGRAVHHSNRLPADCRRTNLEVALPHMHGRLHRAAGPWPGAARDLVTGRWRAIVSTPGRRHASGGSYQSRAVASLVHDDMDAWVSGAEHTSLLGPSMGKSALSLCLARQAAPACGALYFSLEMGRDSLVERLLAVEGRVSAHAIRCRMLTAEQFDGVLKAAGRLQDVPLYLDDSSAPTALMVQARARQRAAAGPLGLVVVDYLQLLAATDRRAPREQQVAAMARDLKALARELRLAVLAVSQLNRAAEAREDHRPRLSDLRESGAIEQEADTVLLVHREDYYHRHEGDYRPNNVAEVIVAKQRSGPPGVALLTFDPITIAFSDPA